MNITDQEAIEIAREVDPAAGQYFRTMLAKAAKLGAQRIAAPTSLRCADCNDVIGNTCSRCQKLRES